MGSLSAKDCHRNVSILGGHGSFQNRFHGSWGKTADFFIFKKASSMLIDLTVYCPLALCFYLPFQSVIDSLGSKNPCRK